MHTNIEDLRSLANAYINKELLTDEQLTAKRHMAVCDDCYGKFCVEYLMQRELMKASLTPPDVWSEPEVGIVDKIILKISQVREQMKLVFHLEEKFQNDARWNFVEMPYLTAARGRGEEAVYQSKVSTESRIYLQDGKVFVELDEEVYQGDTLKVLLVDEFHNDEAELLYDEDTGIYMLEVDLEQYTEALEIMIVLKE